ncbi:YybH family protein [Pseudomonas sp. CR3202]|uniref:YybH family protein n=1 Tax=Pseudomonas sp. CR3202 TaxID=3351532 RepID=UPI003BF14EA3
MIEIAYLITKDHDDIEAAIRKFEETFNSGDIRRAVWEVYTEEAQILPPGGPIIVGRESIANFWEESAQKIGLKSLKLTTMHLELHGDWAHEIGKVVLSLVDGTEVHAKYMVIWKRLNGLWLWDIDIWNMDA